MKSCIPRIDLEQQIRTRTIIVVRKIVVVAADSCIAAQDLGVQVHLQPSRIRCLNDRVLNRSLPDADSFHGLLKHLCPMAIRRPIEQDQIALIEQPRDAESNLVSSPCFPGRRRSG